MHQSFLQAAERLTALLEQERDYAAAISVAQFMRLQTLLGDRAGALRTYHRCSSHLERELGSAPSAATRQIYERLMQQDASPREVPSSLAPQRTVALIGRHQQWQRLKAAWKEATEGHPHLVLLSGEAGIGKTRLAEAMETWVSHQGMTTASARCYAAEGHLPYALVTTWLRSAAIWPALRWLHSPYVPPAECSRFINDERTRSRFLSPCQ